MSQPFEPAYREAILDAWPQRRRYRGGCPAARMAQHWHALQGLYPQKEHL